MKKKNYIIFFLFFVYFTSIHIIKYLKSYLDLDIGIAYQVIWNTLNGNYFYSSIWTSKGIFFKDHFSPILGFLTPLTLTCNYYPLIMFQALTFSISGYFLFMISYHCLKNYSISLIIVLTYFLYPHLNYINIFGFHMNVISHTALFGMMFCMLKKKYKLMWLFTVTALLCKETLPLILSFVFLYFFFLNKEKKMILLSGLNILLFIIIISVVIPFFRLGEAVYFNDYYAHFGGNLKQVITNLLAHPLNMIQYIFSYDKIVYSAKLFFPLLFTPLLNIMSIVPAIPQFVMNLLSSEPNTISVSHQYSLTIIPFLFSGYIFFLSFIKRHTKSNILTMSSITVLVLIACIISNYKYGIFSENFTDRLKNASEYRAAAEIGRSISEMSSVGCTVDIWPYFASRKYNYVFEQPHNPPDYYVLNMNKKFGPYKEGLTNYSFYRKLNDEGIYKIVYSKKNIVVFKR